MRAADPDGTVNSRSIRPPAVTRTDFRSTCGGAFKSPNKAAWLSFIFPGVGDWYLGHRGMAILELIGSSFLWLALVIAPLLSPPNPEIGPLDASRTAMALGSAIGVAAIVFGRGR